MIILADCFLFILFLVLLLVGTLLATKIISKIGILASGIEQYVHLDWLSYMFNPQISPNESQI